MKIEPRKDYKKPLYMAGVATMIGATMLFGTACGEDTVKGLKVRSGHAEIVEPILEGEAQPPELEGETTIDIDYEGDIQIDGEEDIAPPDETEEVELDGDVVIVDDDDLQLEGGETIAEDN